MKKPEKKECHCPQDPTGYRWCDCGAVKHNQACDDWQAYHDQEIASYKKKIDEAIKFANECIKDDMEMCLDSLLAILKGE